MSSWDVARLTVRLGDYNIRVNSEVRHIEKKVKRVVRHRNFDSRTLVNLVKKNVLICLQLKFCRAVQ